jgi:hypothetical protein
MIHGLVFTTHLEDEGSSEDACTPIQFWAYPLEYHQLLGVLTISTKTLQD